MPAWLTNLLGDRVAQNVLSAIGGAVVTVIFSAIRRKLALLPYTVSNNRIGISAQDTIFGNVQLTWQNHPIANLYMSVVELVNSATEDFTDVRLRIYTGNETTLLNERTEVSDSPYIVTYAPDYQARIQVAEGAQPTQQQFAEYWHSREYIVPVLNRGQRLTFRYLTTVAGNALPAVWVATMHKGLKLRFTPNAKMIWGVPVPVAVLTGLIACIVALFIVGWAVEVVWLAAGVGMAVGLFAQPIGALLIKALAAIRRALYH